MKTSRNILLLLGILSGVSGCANLNDSPYYREWHERAYDMRAKTTGLQRDIPAADQGIPEAEPSVVPEAEVTTVVYEEVSEAPATDAYTVEGDAFQTYEQPSQENSESNRNYSYMDRSLN